MPPGGSKTPTWRPAPRHGWVPWRNTLLVQRSATRTCFADMKDTAYIARWMHCLMMYSQNCCNEWMNVPSCCHIVTSGGPAADTAVTVCCLHAALAGANLAHGLSDAGTPEQTHHANATRSVCTIWLFPQDSLHTIYHRMRAAGCGVWRHWDLPPV